MDIEIVNQCLTRNNWSTTFTTCPAINPNCQHDYNLFVYGLFLNLLKVATVYRMTYQLNFNFGGKKIQRAQNTTKF